jgi:hypothetical protein
MNMKTSTVDNQPARTWNGFKAPRPRWLLVLMAWMGM